MRHHRTKTGETILAYVVLAILSFLCLFFFYILIVNSTRSHADLQKGFSWLPGNYFLENLKNVANDGSFPMFKGILNSLIVSSSSAALCTYFSALTAYGLYAYNFKLKKFAFTFIMAILVMPTQVTAMGFLRLMTNMGLYDTLWPLIIPSIASPAVFYFMYSYLKSSLPLSLVEAARIDGSGRVPHLQPNCPSHHEAGHCSPGHLLLRGLLEQLLRPGFDHPVQGQDDCPHPDRCPPWRRLHEL